MSDPPDAGNAFLDALPACDDFFELTDPAQYRPAPDRWLVVVTDVIDSTASIAAGRYADVNVVGGASIAAILNACGRRLPYTFGGDGAMVLVPRETRGQVTEVLNELVRVAREAFDLEVRIGAMAEHLAWGNNHGGVCCVEGPCKFCPKFDEFGKGLHKCTTQNGYKKHRRSAKCWDLRALRRPITLGALAILVLGPYESTS